jgi:hypothetical protein
MGGLSSTHLVKRREHMEGMFLINGAGVKYLKIKVVSYLVFNYLRFI